MWRSRSTRSAVLSLGHLGRSGARARRQRQRTRANWSRRGRYRRAFRRQPGADRPGVAALRSDMQDLFAQLERQLGEGDVQGSAATLHTIKGSASTVGASALAGCASELEQALRRADAARHGNPRRHPPRRTAHPVRCLPAPAGDVRRRAGGVGELNPGAVAVPPRIQADPGSPASAACRANNAMGVIRRYS